MNGAAWALMVTGVWMVIHEFWHRPRATPPVLPAAAAAAAMTEAPAMTEAHGGPAAVRRLTRVDEDVLAQIQSAYPDLHPRAVQRGLALADLLRRTAPRASDAELSRGVLDTSLFLGFVAASLDDPGRFYARVITELDVAALDLTAAELACPSEVTDRDP